MSTAETGEGRRTHGEPPLRKLVHSVCNLLAVISFGLIFGGVLGVLLRVVGNQR